MINNYRSFYYIIKVSHLKLKTMISPEIIFNDLTPLNILTYSIFKFAVTAITPTQDITHWI